MRRTIVIVVFLLAGLGAAAAAFRIDRPLRIAAAAVAHDVCSRTFVAGEDPQQAFDDSLAPRDGLKRIAGALRFKVDRDRHEVDASTLLLLRARAVFYPGLGCIVIHGDEPRELPSAALLAAAHTEVSPFLPDIAGPEIVEPRDPGLVKALSRAFDEPAGSTPHHTKAVVIVHDGHVIAERYAAGVGIDTPLLGFSMTKSATNAMVGILVMQGQLTLNAPVSVTAWAKENDPRRAITLEQLMRMTSGLDLDEENAGPADPSDQMFYLRRDMAAFAYKAKLVAAPGTRWAYSSASTHIVADLVRQAVGGRSIDALSFADRELFAPLGMRHVTLEVDATGTAIGAHYMFASARDWAKLGVLYVNDGVIGDRRILPAGWVEFSSSPTLGRDYGAGFWTLRGQGELATVLRDNGVPGDAFLASGNLGQRILIVPSLHLVIVRLGDDVHNDARGLGALTRDVIASLAP